MSSRGIVDLRKRKPGTSMRPLAFKDPPARRSPLRTRRRRTRIVVLLALIGLLALAAYGVSFASYLPQFSIERIDVSGVENIEPEVVRTFVETELENGSLPFLSSRNIFLYPRRTIETALREYFPRIGSANVSRESLLATAITVFVEERKAFAKWCDETESCYAIDSSGFLFAPASTTPRFDTAYVFAGALSANSAPLGQIYLSGRFAGVLALLERLGQAGISAEKVWLEGEQDFTVMLSRGFEIHAAFGTDVGLLVKNLELILASEALRDKEDQLEYIDLRFGNRVYYKLKGAQQQSSQ